MKKIIKPILLTTIIASLSLFATGCKKDEPPQNTAPPVDQTDPKIEVEVDKNLDFDATVIPAETPDPTSGTDPNTGIASEINESFVSAFNVTGTEITSNAPGVILLSTTLSFDKLKDALYEATKTVNITEISTNEELIEESKVWTYIGTYDTDGNLSVNIGEAGPEGGKIVNAVVYYTK